MSVLWFLGLQVAIKHVGPLSANGRCQLASPSSVKVCVCCDMLETFTENHVIAMTISSQSDSLT